MPKLPSRVIFGLCLSVLMVGTALADNKPFLIKPAPRKPNFFEQLFGGGSNRNKPNWWQQQSGADGNQFKLNSMADRDEPAPLPGLGMGNMTYVPTATLPVYDAAFSKLTSATPDADAIRNVLADKGNNIRAIDVQRRAILAFYSGRNFKPWTCRSSVAIA